MLPTESAIDSAFPDLAPPLAPIVRRPTGNTAPAPLDAAVGRPVSVSVPDWSHRRWNEWAPAKSLIASVRAYQRYAARRGLIALLGRRAAVLRHRFWSLVTAAELGIERHVGAGH